MRVIKFRVRDKTLNTWSINTQHFIHNRFSEKLYVVPEQGNRFIFEQYTGLKDKNGKEIFEAMEINDKYKVIWVSPSFCLQEILSGDIVDFKKGDHYVITKEHSEIP